MSNQQPEQLTLGHLVHKLDALIELGRANEHVMFDFVYFHPTCIHSYRGYYQDVALGYESGYPGKLTVQSLRDLCFDAIGSEFEGYKGGNYTMSTATPVWVGNPKEAGRTAVVGVEDTGYEVILLTAKVE